ncbi:MAG: SAM-dependent chlorinase/fluorinase [Candidatus Hydrogenedentes bacterium]|nr:SAM-dependent chlorinase/fluorinase [Candidatus Hydrogenedentota bacterium]
MPPLVTLTTDFGARDPYVAAMKGVMFKICPGIQIVDLSHDIAPQDVLQGALFLAGAAAYFPEGTIHCAVVDPGVGTDRLALAASAGGQVFVCPDNGLLTLFLRNHALTEARAITNPAFMLDTISPTFHGRDVFAPAAASLARGTPLEAAGERVDDVQRLEIPEAATEGSGDVSGAVIHIDRFGNCITNIHRTLVGEPAGTTVCIGHHRLPGIHQTYGDVAPGAPLALFGSSEYLEIAVNQRDAAAELGIAAGDKIRLTTGR